MIETLDPNLLEISQYFMVLAQKSRDVFWIRGSDYHQQIYISPAYEKVWGRSCDSLYADPNSWMDTIVPDDRENLLARIEERKKLIAPGKEFFDTFRIQLGDEIRWIKESCLVIYNDKNEHIGFAGISHDISENKRYERSLEEAWASAEAANKAKSEYLENLIGSSVYTPLDLILKSDFFLQMADKSQDVFWIRSRDDATQLYVSPAYEKIWGRTCASLYEHPERWINHVHPDDRDKMLKVVAERTPDTTQKTMRALHYRIVRPNGEIRWIKDGTFSIMSETGQCVGYAGVAQDITKDILGKKALEQAKELAEDANQAKSEFLANVSHELRTPLNAILGMAQVLKTCDFNPEQQQCIDAIYNSGHHLLLLINDILDFAKLEAAKLELVSVPVDLRLLIEEVVNSLSLQAHNKNIALLTDYDHTIPSRVYSDPTRLRQILVNLIGNAIKFTQNGYVLIAVECIEVGNDNAKLQILVEDTGPGIEPEKIDAIFDRFTQADNSNKHLEHGTGLGLAITKQLIDLMGGQISVNSQVHKGSTFWCDLKFPLQSDAGCEDIKFDGLQDISVLVVDDNPVRGNIICKYLQQLNTISVDSTSAMPALVQAQNEQRQFEIVIIDNQNSLLSAESLMTEIDQHSELNKILPILLISPDEPIITHKSTFTTINKPLHPSSFLEQLFSAWRKWSKRDAPIKEKFHQAKILLVEDNELNQLVQSKLLENLGCNVVVAGTGDEALNLSHAHKYDIILMDIGLPDISGLVVTEQIRKGKGPNEQVPIIAMTAHLLDSDRKKYFAIGMNDIITKPVLQNQLQSIMHYWLGTTV